MYAGNTVRLTAEFKDLDGNLYDPDDVEVRVLDCTMAELVNATPTKSAVGIYYYDYTLTVADYAFEFNGVIPGTAFPVLSRLAISVSSRL